MENLDTLEREIRNRRAVFPVMYNNDIISKEELLNIMENARWAPTHRLTQPWKFIVFQGVGLKKLSHYLGDYYIQNTPTTAYSDMKYKKTVEKPLKSACVLAIVLSRDTENRVPEWEEIAAVSIAVQNIWLSCSARGIGAYWSSPESALNAHEFLSLKENEKCLGLFYMGRRKTNPPAPDRKPVEEFVRFY